MRSSPRLLDLVRRCSFLVLLATACGAAPHTGTPTGGSGGSGNGAAGGAPVSGVRGTRVPGSAGLPVPSGAANVPAPTGAPSNLRVLNWAGFKAAVTYTFDDAQPSQIEHYPELQATGARMTFFVTSGSSGSATFDGTFSQAVRDGHEIGNHTVHHCHSDLSGCANGAAVSLDEELDACNDYIVQHFGQSAVWTSASPYGDVGYNGAAAQRFFLNRGVQSGTIAANDNTDPFNLPCHPAVAGETAEAFNAVIDSTRTDGRWVVMLIHTLTPTAANWYAPIEISAITDSVAHAKALGDVWIDSMANVGAYWRAQKVLGTTTPISDGGKQTWAWLVPPHFPPGIALRVTVDGGTLSQRGRPLAWDPHGYYEVDFDEGALTLAP